MLSVCSEGGKWLGVHLHPRLLIANDRLVQSYESPTPLFSTGKTLRSNKFFKKHSVSFCISELFSFLEVIAEAVGSSPVTSQHSSTHGKTFLKCLHISA